MDGCRGSSGISSSEAGRDGRGGGMLPPFVFRAGVSDSPLARPTEPDEGSGGGRLPLERPLPFLSLSLSLTSAFGFGDSSSSLPFRRSLSPEARSAILY